MKTSIHMYLTAENLADAFARQLVEWANEAEGDAFHLALSGGKTPSLLFSLLAEKYASTMPWQKVHFWWGDERMVPADDQDSNYGIVNQLLFKRVGIGEGNVHRIKGEASPETEAERYGSEIKSLILEINGTPSFDLVMLGLGDDGHTASIFPDQMQLMGSDRITGVAVHPISGQQRVTLTGKVINNSKRVAFLVSGKSKAQVYNEITFNSDKSLMYPAAHIRPEGELHWFVDEDCIRWA